MPTEARFVELVHDQSGLGERLTYRKMFGEYGFHLDGKFVAMACDDTLFIKPTDALAAMKLGLPSQCPYPGAKPYAVADALLDEPAQLQQLLVATADCLPAPKPKNTPSAPKATKSTEAKKAKRSTMAKSSTKRVPLVFLMMTLIGASNTGCARTESASTTRTIDGEPTFDVSALRQEIEERNRVFTNAHVIGDSAAMVNIFADDARVLPPNADPVIGHRAIELMTAEYLTYGITEFREETTEFYGDKDLLIDEGRYVLVYDNGSTREEGKYVNIWRKEAGEWKLHTNIWNSNAPVPAGR